MEQEQPLIIKIPEVDYNRPCDFRTKMFAAIRTSKESNKHFDICSELFNLFPATNLYQNTMALKIITKYNNLPFATSPLDIHIKMRRLHFDKMLDMFREIVTASPMIQINWLKQPMFIKKEIEEAAREFNENTLR